MVILTKDIGIKFEERFAGKTIVMNNILRYEGRAALAMIGLLTGALSVSFEKWPSGSPR